MNNTLSRRALLRVAPALPAVAFPVAALPDVIPAPAAAALPDWQGYICDITKDVHPGAQRFLRIAAETVANRQINPEPFQPGPIEELLTEYRRRNRYLCDELAVEIDGDHLKWLDEPLHEAMGFMPNTPREFAALFLLVHLDDIVMTDNLAADMFEKCAAMLA